MRTIHALLLASLGLVSIAAKPRIGDVTRIRKLPAPPIKGFASTNGTAITNDDVTSHIRYSGGAPIGDFTAMAWFKLLHDPDSEKTLIIIGGNASEPLYRNSHWVYLANDGNTLAMGSLTPGHFIGTGGYLEENAWHHVALVGNTNPAELFQLYFDGHLVATGQEASDPQEPYVPGMVEFGGLTGHDTDHFSGSFCAAMIFNRKLGASEIRNQMHYLTPLIPAWAAWGLQTNTDLSDLSGNGRNMTTAGISFVNDPNGPPISLAPLTQGPCASQPNGTSCDDGSACTTNDVCINGICLGVMINCDDGNGCTDDFCDPATGCAHTDRSGPCDDGDFCTTDDMCVDGACMGSPLDCDDGNECTDDSCDPVAGCMHSNNTTACDDHDNCTENDACDAGICSGSRIPDCIECSADGDCDDQNECTTDECQSGVCAHSFRSTTCNDGNACTIGDTCTDGVCSGTVINCDDDNQCTDDACDPAIGCVNVNRQGVCDDGNACTTDDACVDGVCTGGPQLNCDDGNQCTDDSCDSATGCVNLNHVGTCDDGNACTMNDTCIDGTCVSGDPMSCPEGGECVDGECIPTNGP